MLSGSDTVSVTAEIEKGKFNHLCFLYDNSIGEKKSKILSGSSVLGESRRFNFGSINTAGNPFLIASGSEISSLSFTPTQTLSGSINNFRA